MKTYDFPQYSDSWWEVRNGIPTASEFKKIITAVKGDLSTSWEKYAVELIRDIIEPAPPFFTDRPGHTAAMRNGTNCEPEARRFYEFTSGETARQVGFCLRDDGKIGCSPDSLIGENGGLELKCPELTTHLLYQLHPDWLLTEYRQQCHANFLVGEGRFKWWKIMSYHPGREPVLLTVVPDEYTEKMAVAVERFLQEFERLKERLLPEQLYVKGKQ